jgi:uncharacterized membrane protein YedE/YeeE
MEFIYKPFPWYLSGFLIATVMITLLFVGKSFGLSSNFRTFCAMCGGGKVSKFFNFDWKASIWNVVFLLGALLGGFLTQNYLMDNSIIDLSLAAKETFSNLGLNPETEQLAPLEIFSFEVLSSWKGWVLFAVGGFFVGFGARYAGGCTSGHAISGLSNLQLPSLIAVIGFFIGGLISANILIPFLLK